MDLVISAVDDVLVDVFENQKYKAYPRENIKAEDILRLVQDRTNGDFDKVQRLFVNMGPGSFTGIRASMALVVGLIAGKNNEVIPFTSFDAFEYDELTAGKVLAVDGFSNFVYVRYIKCRKMVDACVTIDELEKLAKKSEVITNSQKLAKKLLDDCFNVRVVEFNPECVIEKYQQNKLKKIKFEPVYLRLSQAELQRKENMNSGKAKRKN